jgi:hypothetical protein
LLITANLVRESGATLITLCPSQTPLAELSTVNLAIDVHEDTEIYTPLTSRIAHLVVIDVLAMGVAMAARAEAWSTTSRASSAACAAFVCRPSPSKPSTTERDTAIQMWGRGLAPDSGGSVADASTDTLPSGASPLPHVHVSPVQKIHRPVIPAPPKPSSPRAHPELPALALGDSKWPGPTKIATAPSRPVVSRKTRRRMAFRRAIEDPL